MERWTGVLGSVLNDLGIVNSLGGATLGSLIELIFPGGRPTPDLDLPESPGGRILPGVFVFFGLNNVFFVFETSVFRKKKQMFKTHQLFFFLQLPG